MGRVRKIRRLGVVAAVATASLALASSFAYSHAVKRLQAGPVTTVDHAKCYNILGKDGPFAPRTVELDDQFGTRESEVVEPEELCTPVSKNGEPVNRPDAHLKSYRIRHTPQDQADEPERTVIVRNQFGAATLVVGNARKLLVPASKSITAAFPDSPPLGRDHYKCYQVLKADPEHVAVIVDLVDQFTEESPRVVNAVLLCNPVQKRHDRAVFPIVEKDIHLVCYATNRHEAFRRRVVRVVDQFGRERLEVRNPRMLCVPSHKEFKPPPPPPPPVQADFGDAPESDELLFINGCVGPPTNYPSRLASNGPFHLDFTDSWLGAAPSTTTAEPDAILPNCDDWLFPVFDADDGCIVLIIPQLPPTYGWACIPLDGGGVFPLAPPPAPGCYLAFWTFQVSVDGGAPPDRPRFANVVVDDRCPGPSTFYGDDPLEHVLVNAPVAAAPGGTQALVTGLFFVELIVNPFPPPGGPTWAILPFWTRFMVSEDPVPVPWNGEGPAGGFEFGETEDVLVLGDPGKAGDHDLTVDKTDTSDPVRPGERFDYLVSVTNEGPGAASNVTVSDQVVGPGTVVSATASQGTCSQSVHNGVVCNLGTLAAGETAVVTITVQADIPGQFVNEAEVSSVPSDRDATNNRDVEQTSVTP